MHESPTIALGSHIPCVVDLGKTGRSGFYKKKYIGCILKYGNLFKDFVEKGKWTNILLVGNFLIKHTHPHILKYNWIIMDR